jgi:hypothetical protein
MSRKALRSSFMVSVVLIVAILLSGYYVASIVEKSGFPLTAVEETLGVKGTELTGGVYMFSLPRDGIQVRIGDVTLSPAMALDSGVAFVNMGGEWMMMGDLVLEPGQLLPAQDAVRREGLDITAIHNTLVGETPQVYDLHIGGSGDPETIARALQAVLKAANFTVSPSGNHAGTMPQYLPDAGMIDRILGANGTYEDGVLQYRMPRAETIVENGVKIPSSMDVATVIKLQPLPEGQAAVTSEFVLMGDEVQPVFRKLNDNGIMVTAIHSHMLEEQPRLIYMHVWAVGDSLELARGLREALDQTNVVS